jgi:hypothetical protein
MHSLGGGEYVREFLLSLISKHLVWAPSPQLKSNKSVASSTRRGKSANVLLEAVIHPQTHYRDSAAASTSQAAVCGCCRLGMRDKHSRQQLHCHSMTEWNSQVHDPTRLGNNINDAQQA